MNKHTTYGLGLIALSLVWFVLNHYFYVQSGTLGLIGYLWLTFAGSMIGIELIAGYVLLTKSDEDELQ